MAYRQVGKLADFGKQDAMIEAQRRTVDRVGSLMLDRVILHTPVAKPPAPQIAEQWLAERKRVPGTLKASWRQDGIRLEGSVMSVDVYTHDSIARFVEFPTLPHVIVPKNGGMLRFYAQGSGDLVYASIVHHTGTKGSYMLATTIGEVAVEWRAIGAEEMERWAVDQRAAIAA